MRKEPQDILDLPAQQAACAEGENHALLSIDRENKGEDQKHHHLHVRRWSGSYLLQYSMLRTSVVSIPDAMQRSVSPSWYVRKKSCHADPTMQRNIVYRKS